MTDKHTPGPWEAVREGPQEWSIWYSFVVDGETKPRTSWLADSITSEADARLIASAPDLYRRQQEDESLLRQALKALNYVGVDPIDREEWEETEAIIAALRERLGETK